MRTAAFLFVALVQTVCSSAMALPCLVAKAEVVEGGVRLTFAETAQWSLFLDDMGNEGGIFQGKIYRVTLDGVELKVLPEPEDTFTLRGSATLQLLDTHRGCNLAVAERGGQKFLRSESGLDLPGGAGRQSQEKWEPL